MVKAIWPQRVGLSRNRPNQGTGTRVRRHNASIKVGAVHKATDNILLSGQRDQYSWTMNPPKKYQNTVCLAGSACVCMLQHT
jgi:hypothetical protein